MAISKRKQRLPGAAKWMQRFFSIAGNIAPATTISILVRLLFTPRKRPLKPAHLECLKRAERFSFEVNEFRNPKKKLQLSCYSWGKGDRTVLLLHGWDARALDFYKMIPVLVEEGYRVIAFDGPGHGSSEGERSNLVDFKEILYQLIAHKIGVPYAIVGHSMGGGAAVYFLMDYSIRIKKLITIASPTVTKRFFETLFHEMKVPPKMQKAFFAGMAEEFGEPVENYNLIERKEHIKADDILMIYDEDDDVVPVKDIKDFLHLHPRIKQLNMKGVGHYSIIRSKHVIDAVTGFLQ